MYQRFKQAPENKFTKYEKGSEQLTRYHLLPERNACQDHPSISSTQRSVYR